MTRKILCFLKISKFSLPKEVARYIYYVIKTKKEGCLRIKHLLLNRLDSYWKLIVASSITRLGSKPCNHSPDNFAPSFDKAEAYQVVLSEPDYASHFFNRYAGIFKKTGILGRTFLLRSE